MGVARHSTMSEIKYVSLLRITICVSVQRLGRVDDASAGMHIIAFGYSLHRPHQRDLVYLRLELSDQK